MKIFKRENLWFCVACCCIFSMLIVGLYAIALTIMCQDLNDVVSMKDTYIKELETQKERLSSDVRYCIEQEYLPIPKDTYVED